MEFQLGSASGSFRLVVNQIEMDAGEVHAWVAIRNEGPNAVPGPDGVAVSHFIPADVVPLIPCPECAVQDLCPCVFDHRGTYGDDGLLEVGETSTPVEWRLSNPSGESFAFRARISGENSRPDGVIAGAVFRDANANGHRENSEPGIPGVPVTLYDPNGTMNIGFTNPSGEFEFTVTEVGLYEIIQACPPCGAPSFPCQFTTPDRYQVLIVRRADGTLSSFLRADFGCAGDVRPDSAQAEGVVFDDLNRNGVQDPGEAGIPSVRMQAASLACPDRAPVVTYTDMRGHYVLLLPECGPPWSVEREEIEGYIGTTPNPVWIHLPVPGEPPVPGDPTFPNFHVDFGVAVGNDMFPRYSIEGTVFLDANENGMLDTDEVGIGGVGVSASSLVCEIPVLAYAETDHAGRYRLDGAQVHCPLPWVVQAYLDRQRPTTPLPVQLDGPPADGMTYHVDFGFAPPDSIPEGTRVLGTVFMDFNGNGMRDRGEPGVPGAEVTLLTPLDVIIATRSGHDGHYEFRPYPMVFGVWQSAPEYPNRTTPNPVNFEPNGSPKRVVDFGIGVGPARP